MHTNEVDADASEMPALAAALFYL